MVLHSPYIRWQGDETHGRYPVLTPVLVSLDALYPRIADAPRRTVPDGLDLVGEVPGMLSGWFRSVQGDWLAALSSLDIAYADGRHHRLHLVDQLVPGHCVRAQNGSASLH